MKQGVHLAKYKRSDVGGIQAEQKRLYKDIGMYKNDVNPGLTQYNTVINYLGDESWTRYITNAVKDHQKQTGKKIRKDAVVLGSFVESVPNSWGHELVQEYFTMQHDVKMDLLKKHGLDDNCELSHIIHFDEENPHCTDTFMPLNDMKFNFKKICNRGFFRELGQVCWQAYKEFEQTHALPEKLEEPEWNSGRKHKDDLKLKIDTLQKETELLKTDKAALELEIDLLTSQNEKLKNDYSSLLKRYNSTLKHVKMLIESIQPIERLRSLLHIAKSFKNEFGAFLEMIREDYHLDDQQIKQLKNCEDLIENNTAAQLDQLIDDVIDLQKKTSSKKKKMLSRKENEHE